MTIRTAFPGRGTLIEETLLAGEAKGRVKERAHSVLRVLEARGIPASDETRERITECTDLDILDQWMVRAVTVTTAEELFDEEG